MNKRLGYIILIAFITASLILTACGSESSKPDIAPFPDSEPDTGLYEEIRAEMEQGELNALEGLGLSMEIKAYITASSVDDVMAYYRDMLADWQEENLDAGGTDATIIKWSSDTQAVVVIYIPDSSGGEENGLFVEESWPEE